MSNIRYYIAITIGTVLMLTYWFNEDASVSYERPVADQNKIQAGKELADNSCISCHSPQNISKYPYISGMNPMYIKKQLEDYKSGSGIRDDKTMSAIADKLTPADIENLSSYFSSLSLKIEPSKMDEISFSRAEDLALRGRSDLPRCSACHGDKGEGFRELFPPLAGQNEAYILEQLNRWQNGSRSNDENSMMKNIANRLSEEDKKDLAAYYSTLGNLVSKEK